MKTLYILALYSFISMSISAQTAKDTLCQTKLDTLCAGLHSKEYSSYNKNENRFYYLISHHNDDLTSWNFRIDSVCRTHVTFYDSEDRKPLDGWYKGSVSYIAYSFFEFGLTPYTSYAMERVRRISEYDCDYTACFNNGIPCCTWQYEYKLVFDTISLHKTENFDNGQLHGDYVIYNTKKDTLYQTSFNHGTGHYRELYPNGKLQFEGDLIGGRRDGIWTYYFYDLKKDNCKEIRLEYYNKGKVLKHDRLEYYQK